MGGGRKTRTYNMVEKLPPCYTTNGSAPARNLRKGDLGGVIFGCTNYTIQECFSKQLFGLPAGHFSYVKNVSVGLVLFLFNYSDRMLHGIFEAASPGQMNINPQGWTSDGDEMTPYAAQVRVHIRQWCRPLTEEMFSPIIPGNYYQPKLFRFELDPSQTRKLIDLFMSSPEPERAPHLKTITMSKDIFASTSDARSKADDGNNAPRGRRRDIEVNAKCGLPDICTVGNSGVINTNKAWSSLFKPSPDSDSTGKGDIVVPQEAMSQSLTQSDQSMGETVSPSISPSVGDGQQYEFWEDPWDSGNFEEPVNCSVTSPSAGDGQRHGSSEDSWRSDNFEKTVDSSGCIPSSILTEIGQPSYPPMHNNRKETPSNAVPNATSLSSYHDIDTAPLLPRTEINSADTDIIVTEKDHGSNSFDLRMALSQLVREIDVLKVSHSEQNQRIRSLEQELIESKLEIQHLRNQSVLVPAPSGGPLEEVKFELPPVQDDKSVYMVGGFNGSSWSSGLDSYSVSHDLMKSLSPMTFLRSYCSVTTLDGQLYVLGGANENVWYDTVEFYSPTTDKWGQLPLLTKKKGSMSSASLFGNLYAFGGGNGVNVFSDVEMFDFNVGRWFCIQTMDQKRFASAAIENDSALYVVGGYDGINYLSSSARLDPREKKWTKIGTMHTARGCHSVVTLNGKLVALGGFDGSKMVPTVEVLDPRFGSWTVVQSMNVSRGYSGTVAMDGKIYTFGGVNQGGEITDTIECYSEDRGWEMTDLKTMGKRCFFSAIVL